MLWDRFKFTKNKAKLQAEQRISNYINMGVNTLLEMFDIDNIGELDYRFFNQIRLYCIQYGLCYVTKSPKTGELTIYHGNFGGEPDMYGMGKHFIGATLNGETIDEDWHIGVVFRNNKTYSSEWVNIERFACALNNNDVALNSLVQYSMVTPFAFVKDSKMKKAIDEFLNNSLIGKPLFMLMNDKNVFVNEISGKEMFEKLDITDVQLADKLQYISQYSDDLKRRFYTFYGHSQAGAHKMAQQSIDEISADDTISMIYPNALLKVLKEDIEIFNEKFGYNVTVSFSESWKAKEDDIIDSIEDNGDTEETEEVEEKEGASDEN